MDTRNQMSWPSWSTTAPPIPTAAVPNNPIQSSLLPTSVNSAPSVLPPGIQYSPEQWAQAQQHNWQQWAQWQQQYQQWHQQYGAEYQKSLTAMQSTMTPTQPPLPALVNTTIVPPLPENKPPLPPEEPPLNQEVPTVSTYTSFATKPPQTGYNTVSPITVSQLPSGSRLTWQQKKMYGQETDYCQGKRLLVDQWSSQKEISSTQSAYQQPPPQITPKVNAEELSEAEKKFDKEFAAWEAQFQKWKEQNANHPDKTQYREYEKKWESWRNSLLERREQMRKKRLALSSNVNATQVVKIPNFTQPPPTISQQIVGNTALADQEHYTSLPPNQNNEPLSFKKETDQVTSGGAFLGSTSLIGDIPGLDLVKGDDNDHDMNEKELPDKGPDLDALSKGINSILGDQKLLNMLSMVTKHPPPAPTQPPVSNYQENQFVNITLPPPTVTYRDNCNDQSNHSFEDRSNQGDYHQREAVNNFDDQTRSSFTMGLNDPDQSFRNRNQSGRYGDDRFGNGFNSTLKCNLIENSVPKSLLSLTFPPGGPKMIHDDYAPSGIRNIDNFGPSGSRNNFGQSRNENFRQRGADNFNRFVSKNDFETEHYTPENRGNSLNRNDNFVKIGVDNLQSKIDSYNKKYIERDDSRSYTQVDEYENYNDDDDYDKYHNIFNEDEHQYQEDNNCGVQSKNQFQEKHLAQESKKVVTSKEPEILKPVLPLNQEPSPEDSIFEPVKVIDYEHKSLHQAEVEVTIEPIHMFDYRHKPLNRIPLTHRPIWLTESVKFIREFDPLGSRLFERSTVSTIDKIGWYPSVDRPRTFERSSYQEYDREEMEMDRIRMDYARNSENHDRNHREHRLELDEESRHDRNSYGNESNNKFKHKHDAIHEIDSKRPRLDTDNKQENTEKDDDSSSKHIDESGLNDVLEELSDEDMDWEAGERQKLNIQKDESRVSSRSNSPILSNPPNPTNNTSEIQIIEDIINPPGRFNRPPRIVIILRGPPGSGKTYLARLIKDKEVENGGSAPRILSLDDYFMVEHEKSVVEDGKNVNIKEMIYEYEAEMEESYRTSFVKSFKKTITDGYFPFVIVDNVNDKVKYFGEMWSFAKQNGFQVYICQLDLDPVLCTKRNIHNRTQAEIEECIAGWEPTPSHHPTIDATVFLQSNHIKEVEMEVLDKPISEQEPNKDEPTEPNLMDSTNRSEKTEQWKNTFKWKGSGNPRSHLNRGRRGFAGPTWKNKGNWRR